MAEVACETKGTHARIRVVESLDRGPTRVATSVVDEQNLVFEANLFRRGYETLLQSLD